MVLDLHLVTVKPKVAEVAAWDEAARRAGLTRHAWIRLQLAKASGYGEGDEIAARSQKVGGSSE